MKKRIILLPFYLFTLLLLMSCSKVSDMIGGTATSDYSTWPCMFLNYDNTIHNDATLAASINAGSRGVFCIITEDTHGGKKYVTFKNANGDSSEQPETVEEQIAKFILGLNNGIIVGFQTLNADDVNGGFIGYDLQCPNCVRAENNMVNPNYRLTINDNGIATCGKCKRTYDMNNNGLVNNGMDGHKLEKYVAVTDGQHISVFRR